MGEEVKKMGALERCTKHKGGEGVCVGCAMEMVGKEREMMEGGSYAGRKGGDKGCHKEGGRGMG